MAALVIAYVCAPALARLGGNQQAASCIVRPARIRPTVQHSSTLLPLNRFPERLVIAATTDKHAVGVADAGAEGECTQLPAGCRMGAHPMYVRHCTMRNNTLKSCPKKCPETPVVGHALVTLLATAFCMLLFRGV